MLKTYSVRLPVFKVIYGLEFHQRFGANISDILYGIYTGFLFVVVKIISNESIKNLLFFNISVLRSPKILRSNPEMFRPIT